MPRTRCGNGRWQRPRCPKTGCEAYISRLVLLDTRTTPVLAFDQPRKQEQPCRSRFLNLPLDVLEQIFAYLLVAPAEIYLGVVALDHQLPHHWHPAYYLRPDEPRDNRDCQFGLGRTPVCRQKRAQMPYGFSIDVLLVNRQLHVIAARMLYGRNAFAIDIGVPNTPEDAQGHDISRLQLEQIIPLNPAYHTLLRRIQLPALQQSDAHIPRADLPLSHGAPSERYARCLHGVQAPVQRRIQPIRLRDVCRLVSGSESHLAHGRGWISGYEPTSKDDQHKHTHLRSPSVDEHALGTARAQRLPLPNNVRSKLLSRFVRNEQRSRLHRAMAPKRPPELASRQHIPRSPPQRQPRALLARLANTRVVRVRSILSRPDLDRRQEQMLPASHRSRITTTQILQSSLASRAKMQQEARVHCANELLHPTNLPMGAGGATEA